MNIIDSITLAIVVLSTLYGIWKGFTRISLNLCLWIIVSIAIAHFQAPVATRLKHFITSPLLAQITSSVIILIGVIIIGSFLSDWIIKIVRSTPISGLDRLLGGILGAICGVTFIIIIFFVMDFLPNTTLHGLESNSQLTPYIQLEVNQLKLLASSLNFSKNSHSLLNSLSHLSNLNNFDSLNNLSNLNNFGKLNNLNENIDSLIQDVEGTQ